MHNSKLIRRLKILRPEDLPNLEKWLRSPWCNSNKTLVKFYLALKPYYPAFSAPQLTKEKIFKKTYPTKPYNKAWMYNLMSGLYKQIDRFQAHEQVRINDQLTQYYSLLPLLHRESLDLFKKRAKELIDSLEQKPSKTLFDLFQLIHIYENFYQLPVPHQEAINSLDKFDSYLDQFHSIGKYRFFLEAAEGNLKFENKLDLDQQLNNLYELNNRQTTATAKVYQSYLENIDKPLLDRFTNLEQVFFENFDQMEHRDKKIILNLLLNENTRLIQVSKDNYPYLEKAFELFQIGLDHELLFYSTNNTYMRPDIFANIVNTSNYLGKMEFSQSFIEKYHEMLEPHIQKNMHTWAKVHLAYYKGDSESWELAKEIVRGEFSNNVYAIRAKVLVTQMWIEDFIQGRENNLQFVLNICDSFERQLNSKVFKASKNTSPYRKFVRYAKKLIITFDQEPSGGARLANLKDMIVEESNLHLKDWFLKKIEEIKA